MKRSITYTKEGSKLMKSAIIYFSVKRGAEMHTADCIPENLGFFKDVKTMKREIRSKIIKEFYLPVRIEIRERDTNNYNPSSADVQDILRSGKVGGELPISPCSPAPSPLINEIQKLKGGAK